MTINHTTFPKFLGQKKVNTSFYIVLFKEAISKSLNVASKCYLFVIILSLFTATDHRKLFTGGLS